MRQRSGPQIVVYSLVATGVASIVAAIVLGIVVDPLLALIALAGALDLVVAWGFATGRLGSGPAEAPGEPVPRDPSEDPSYNPYARED